MANVKYAEPPLCVNCKHHAQIGPHTHLCGASQQIDLVTGRKTEAKDCHDMRAERAMLGVCGRVGKLFEKKDA